MPGLKRFYSCTYPVYRKQVADFGEAVCIDMLDTWMLWTLVGTAVNSGALHKANMGDTTWIYQFI